MILGAEIALIIYGILAMFRGKFSIGKGRDVTGNKARLLGFICLIPLPLSFLFGLFIGLLSVILYGNSPTNIWLYTGIELIILLAVAVVVSVLGKEFYQQQEQSTPGIIE